MPGYVETGLNFVGVEECAAGHLLVAEKGKIGERYLLGGENITLKQVLDTLSKITGLPAPRLKIPHGLALGVAYANTIFSRLLGRATRIGFQRRACGRSARARRPLVRGERLHRKEPCEAHGARRRVGFVAFDISARPRN